MFLGLCIVYCFFYFVVSVFLLFGGGGCCEVSLGVGFVFCLVLLCYSYVLRRHSSIIFSLFSEIVRCVVL